MSTARSARPTSRTNRRTPARAERQAREAGDFHRLALLARGAEALHAAIHAQGDARWQTGELCPDLEERMALLLNHLCDIYNSRDETRNPS